MVRGLVVAAVAAVALMLPARGVGQDMATLAQQRFLHGLQLYDSGQFEPALVEFRESYALRASPNSRLYMARALAGLERIPEAVTEYDTVIAEALEYAQADPRYEPTATAARGEIARLEPRIGRIRLRVDGARESARVRIAGRIVPRGALGLAIPVLPGRVEVVVEADGYAPAQRQVDVAGGASVDVGVTLEALPHAAVASTVALGPQAPATPSGQRGSRGTMLALGVTGLGVGAAGLISFGVCGLWANSLYEGLRTRCGDGACTAADRGDVGLGRTLQTATNASLAVGLVGAAAGVTLLLLAPRAERVPVRVGIGPGGVAVDAWF